MSEEVLSEIFRFADVAFREFAAEPPPMRARRLRTPISERGSSL